MQVCAYTASLCIQYLSLQTELWLSCNRIFALVLILTETMTHFCCTCCCWCAHATFIRILKTDLRTITHSNNKWNVNADEWIHSPCPSALCMVTPEIFKWITAIVSLTKQHWIFIWSDELFEFQHFLLPDKNDNSTIACRRHVEATKWNIRNRLKLCIPKRGNHFFVMSFG